MDPSNDSSKGSGPDDKSNEIDRLISSISSQPNTNAIDNIDFDALLGSVGIVSPNLARSSRPQTDFNLVFNENTSANINLTSPSQTDPKNQNQDHNRDFFNINELEKVMAEAQMSLMSSTNPSDSKKINTFNLPRNSTNNSNGDSSSSSSKNTSSNSKIASAPKPINSKPQPSNLIPIANQPLYFPQPNFSFAPLSNNLTSPASTIHSPSTPNLAKISSNTFTNPQQPSAKRPISRISSKSSSNINQLAENTKSTNLPELSNEIRSFPNSTPQHILSSDLKNPQIFNQNNLLYNQMHPSQHQFIPGIMHQIPSTPNSWQPNSFQNVSNPRAQPSFIPKARNDLKPSQPQPQPQPHLQSHSQQHPRPHLSRISSNSSLKSPKVDGVPAHEHIARLMGRLPHAKQLQLSQFLAQLRQNKISTKTFIDLATSILGDDLTDLLETLFNKPAKPKQSQTPNTPARSSPVTPSNSEMRRDSTPGQTSVPNLSAQSSLNPAKKPDSQSTALSSNVKRSFSSTGIHLNDTPGANNILGISFDSTPLQNQSANVSPKPSEQPAPIFVETPVKQTSISLQQLQLNLGNDIKKPNTSSSINDAVKLLQTPLSPINDTSLGSEADFPITTPKNSNISLSNENALQQPSTALDDIMNSPLTNKGFGTPEPQSKSSGFSTPNTCSNRNLNVGNENKPRSQNSSTNSKEGGNLSVQQLSNLDRLEVIVRGEQHSLESLINLSRYLAIHGEDIVKAREPTESELTPSDLTSRLLRVQKIQSQIAQKQLLLQQRMKQKSKQDQIKVSQESKNSPKVNEIIENIQNATTQDSSIESKLNGIDIKKDLVPMLKKLSKYKLSKLAKSGNDINSIIHEYNKQVLKENKLKGTAKKPIKGTPSHLEDSTKSASLDTSLNGSSPAFSGQSDAGSSIKMSKPTKSSSANLLESASNGPTKKIKEEPESVDLSTTKLPSSIEISDQASRGIKRHSSTDQISSDSSKDKLGDQQTAKRHKPSLSQSAIPTSQLSSEGLKSPTPATALSSGKNANITATSNVSSGVIPTTTATMVTTPATIPPTSSTATTAATTASSAVAAAAAVAGNDDKGAGSKNIDDVMSMAGIDLREERQNILLSSFSQNNPLLEGHDGGPKSAAEEEHAVTTVIVKKVAIVKDSNYKPVFLNEFSLDNLVSTIAERNGISTVGVAVTGLLSESITVRITSLVKSMISAAYHRMRTQTFPPPRLNPDNNLPLYRIQPKFDVRKQLAALEKVDKNRERRYLESLLMGETAKSAGAAGASSETVEGADLPGSYSLLGLGQTAGSSGNISSLPSTEQFTPQASLDSGSIKADGRVSKGSSANLAAGKGSTASGKRKRTSNVNQGIISQLSSNKLSLAYAAVSGSGGSGSMLSARNMPDEVRSKITNQTALMSVGGVRKSWMLSGSLTSGWQNPSSSGLSPQNSGRSGSGLKTGKSSKGGSKAGMDGRLEGKSRKSVSGKSLSKTLEKLSQGSAEQTGKEAGELEARLVADKQDKLSPVGLDAKDSSIANSISVNSGDRDDIPDIATTNTSNPEPPVTTTSAGSVGSKDNRSVSASTSASASKLKGEAMRHSSLVQGSNSGSNRKSSRQLLSQLHSGVLTRKQPVSVTLRDGLFCLEQERELARKELGQGIGIGNVNGDSARLISGNSSAGVAILVKAYSLLQKD